MQAMKTPHEIVDLIGRETIRDAFRVQDDVINKHLRAGHFPASWYDTLERLADRDLPRSLFTFKGRAA